MPQITLEYTNNIQNFDAAATLAALNQALFATGNFANEQDLKARASAVDAFVVGVNMAQQAFIHLKIAVVAGRAMEVRKQLADIGLDILQKALPSQSVQVQLAAEVQEITLGCYSRAIRSPNTEAA